jgi:hypothetical protein
VAPITISFFVATNVNANMKTKNTATRKTPFQILATKLFISGPPSFLSQAYAPDCASPSTSVVHLLPRIALRERESQESLPRLFGLGGRNAVLSTWTTLEIAYCDALGIEKLESDFKRSLDEEFSSFA